MEKPLPHIHTLVELWDQTYAQHGQVDKPFLYIGPTTEGKAYSRKEVNAFAHCLAAYFLAQGMQKGDTLLLFAINEPVYIFYELALQMAGLINVTVDHYTTTSHLQQIYDEVKPKAIIVPSYDEYLAHKEWLDERSARCPILCQVEKPEDMDENDRVTLLHYAMEYGKVWWRENRELVQQRKQSVRAGDVASIVYDMRRNAAHHKGVVLTQGHFVEALRTIMAEGPQLQQRHRMLCILSHAYLLQRLYAYHLPIALGLDLHYSLGPAHLFKELQQGEPKILVLVPELLHLLRKETFKHYRKGRLLKRRYYKTAFTIAHRVLRMRHLGQKVPFGLKIKYFIAREQIIKPVRKKYFKNLQLLVCAHHGLSEELEYYCHALRLPLVTGSGLNETTGVLAINLKPNEKPLSAGRMIQGLDARIGAGNMLEVKGPLVMKGYWKEKELTQGWYPTGLQGARLEDGWLYVQPAEQDNS